jgi:hypothetical protein
VFGWFKPRQSQGSEEPPRFALASVPDALDRAGPILYLNWPAIEAWIATLPKTTHDAKAYRDEVLRQWMDELADAFGEPYVWAESGELIVLTAREASDARDLLAFAGRCYAATKEVVGPPAGLPAKLALLCFGSQEHMYDYLAPMDADDGEYGGVGGFCVQCDPPHIVVPDLPASIESVLLHEMTHACLGADVPSWLQEGIAQLVEERLMNRRRPPMDEREIRRQRHHWSKRGLSTFWSGESFKAADRGQELSYQLAYVLVSVLLGDHNAALPAFLRTAGQHDHGASAAESLLGFTLGHLAARFLGPGDWEPSQEPRR